MKILSIIHDKLHFEAITGMKDLNQSIGKFRELRDSYRTINRQYYGDYLFSILEQK